MADASAFLTTLHNRYMQLIITCIRRYGKPAAMARTKYLQNRTSLGSKKVIRARLEATMSPATVFQMQLVLGYVPWLLCFSAYGWQRLKAMDRAEAQRAIAAVHSFRFFGLVFIVPGVVGPNLPTGFATFAAYGDFATGLLAMLALMTVRIRPVFWLFVVAFNLVGAVDIIVDYYHGNQLGLPAVAGALGATYAIPIIYVPLLMVTHAAAFHLLVRPPAAE